MFGLRARFSRLRYGLDYGRMVHERTRFALNETINRDMIGVYRPRGGGMPVSLHHHYSPDGTPSNDTWTLREIFRDGCYVPPPPIDALLRARGTPRIADVGANVGLFSAFMLGRYPAAQIVAFEPDPENARLLARSLNSASVRATSEVHRACASSKDGAVRFIPGQHQFSHVAESGEPGAIEVPTVDAFPALQDTDLAKIDIEGGEWEILADHRFAAMGPRSLVMEYHPRLCPGSDPRVFAERLLTEAGYLIVPSLSSAEPSEPILWAVRSDDGGRGSAGHDYAASDDSLAVATWPRQRV
jgi:FkbM family methyltransferase